MRKYITRNSWILFDRNFHLSFLKVWVFRSSWQEYFGQLQADADWENIGDADSMMMISMMIWCFEVHNHEHCLSHGDNHDVNDHYNHHHDYLEMSVLVSWSASNHWCNQIRAAQLLRPGNRAGISSSSSLTSLSSLSSLSSKYASRLVYKHYDASVCKVRLVEEDSLEVWGQWRKTDKKSEVVWSPWITLNELENMLKMQLQEFLLLLHTLQHTADQAHANPINTSWDGEFCFANNLKNLHQEFTQIHTLNFGGLFTYSTILPQLTN